jgi:hypothetical protein
MVDGKPFLALGGACTIFSLSGLDSGYRINSADCFTDRFQNVLL